MFLTCSRHFQQMHSRRFMISVAGEDVIYRLEGNCSVIGNGWEGKAGNEGLHVDWCPDRCENTIGSCMLLKYVGGLCGQLLHRVYFGMY